MIATESIKLPPQLVRASVPRYYFHIFDGREQRDGDGTELPDFEAARVEAIRCAGEILRDQAHHIALGDEWRMEVTDETGLILLRLDFSAQASSAVPHSSERELRSVASRGPWLVR